MDFAESTDLTAELETAVMEAMQPRKKSRGRKKGLPDELFLFPIHRRPFFPGMAAPLMIEPGPYYEALKEISNSDQKAICVILTKKEDIDLYKVGFNDIYKVGVLARILRIIPMEQGGAQVILNMEKRVKIGKQIKHAGCLKAHVSYHDDVVGQNEELKAYAISIISTIKDLLKLNPLFKEELQIFLSHSDFTEPGKLADFAVALTTASREDLQDVLETFNIQGRIDKALVLLKKELDLSKLQNSINQKIESAINKTQKEFYLREQLKTIKRELGLEKDDKTADREKFESRIRNKQVPDQVKATVQEELDKISSLEPQSSEYSLCKNYLDWLTIVPWSVKDGDIHPIVEASKILEHDHYGLEDLKKRILEFIGVAKLAGTLKGNILCLVGPPGVGKTSVGKSIAKALNRKFYRFSVGGMRDEAEIKGHRRTYIGAMPGKIIQALKLCQTMNPVIMIDEVDKIGSSYHGDPASALLEVLDPEQNCEFLDHYLDVRCDLSDILFILTANVLDNIPEALADRMDVMRLSGYIAEEKMQIAKHYLIPKQRKIAGLKASQIEITDPALRQLIHFYAREAGVRSLENNIKKILRKVALDIVREQEKHTKKKIAKVRIVPDILEKYLGKPLFHSERLYEVPPVGVSVGLAWTSLGGATLYVESIKVFSEKTEMKLTGQAGQVMKESSEIAWSYLHGAMHKYAPGRTFFEKCQVHMHIPEGATPKDGPSAGITMVTSLLSLLIDQPIINNLGMTGEITLTGKVLPIGGVKEKVVAARRSNLTELIMPRENVRDVDELSDEIKQGITFHFVEHYDEVFKVAFPSQSLGGL